jgi:hypothetical protein
MKKILALAATVALGGSLLLTVPSPAQAASCSTSWGSTAERLTNNNHGTLVGIRSGRHTCFDRLVLDLNRNDLGYRVAYVSTVYTQGQGAPMALRGGARLEIVSQSMVTKRPVLPSVAGYTTFRQVGFGGSFEGYSTIGLGVRAKLPFRAFRTTNKLVIDVAHRW